jgi:hypothetical protein
MVSGNFTFLEIIMAESNGLSINRPLTFAEMKLIREVLEEGMNLISIRADERDKRYEERFRNSEAAVNTALAAQKEAVAAAFTASERAITKAEDAQAAYNSRSNEFRQTLDDQAKLLLSAREANQRFDTQDGKLEDTKSRIGKMETAMVNLPGVVLAVEDIKARLGKMDTTLATLTSTSAATEKDTSRVVLYIGMALSFLFSLVGVLGMIYSFIKKGP